MQVAETNEDPATDDVVIEKAEPTAKIRSYPVEKFINFKTVTIFAAVFSITFQSTRLMVISPVLTSYITPSDAFLKIGIAMPFIGGFIFLLLETVENFSKRLQMGEGYKGSNIQILMRYFLILLLGATAIWLAVTLYRTSIAEITWNNSRPAIELIGKSIFVIVCFRIFVLALWHLSVLRYEAETTGRVTEEQLSTLLVIGLGSAIIAGLLTAVYPNTNYCAIKTPDGIQNGYLLAALQSVTAIEIDDQKVIMSNSQVLQINCDIPLPKTDELALPQESD
jgi:hypothetical protein